jgi:hypothetical protein
MYLGEWEEVEVKGGGEETGEKGSKKKRRHRAGPGRTEEDRSEGERASVAKARKRIETHEKLEQSGSTLRALPEGRPDKEIRWDPEEQERGTGIWKRYVGTGHREVDEEKWADDPLTRMFVRWGAFEHGSEHVIATTPEGQQMRVNKDKEEQRVLEEEKGEVSIREANKVARERPRRRCASSGRLLALGYCHT